MKIVYITGCLGFIGSYVTEECLKRGWKVYGIDKCTYAANLDMLDIFEKYSNFKFKKMDICDLKRINDCDYFINTAAESHVANSIVDSDTFMKSNINGVKNILDVIRFKQENCVDRPIFFQFSTDEVYGDRLEGDFVEADLLKPSNPYSASKAAADMLTLAWSRTYNINYIIFRPTNNYGIRQHQEKLIPLSVRNLNWGKKIKLHNQGEPIKTWLHAYDTAMAVIRIIESGVKNEIYNVSGGFEQPNKEAVKKIISAYYNTDKDFDQYLDLNFIRKGQDLRYAISDKKLRTLGWKPERKFDEEIQNIVNYYKENFRW